MTPALARPAFVLPTGEGGSPMSYLCGHSLGPMPRAARARVEHELARWAGLGVHGHVEGDPGWIDIVAPLQAPLARLVGAEPDEVVAMNALSVNLQLMLATFHRPRGRRRRVLLGPRPFPSDLRVAASNCRLLGLDPDEAVVVAETPPPGGSATDAIVQAIAAQGEQLCGVCVEAVAYLDGERIDLARVAAAAAAVGAWVGADLAHAIGHVPLHLHASGVDFAVWCSYKYLNAGPGALGGAFVHRRHHGGAIAHASGWWGVERADRFGWDPARQRSAPGAQAWQLSNPPVLQAAALRGALEVFEPHTMQALCDGGRALARAAREALAGAAADGHLEVLTPAAPERHGQMLALRVGAAATGLETALRHAGVVVDARGDIVRAAFCPLYNGLDDVRAFVHALEGCL